MATSKRYVALLRGINVGGRVIKMADLKNCFEKMGFGEVKTLLQTGNVVFESGKNAAELKPMIETKLTDTFSYPAKVQVYDLQTVGEIVAASPFDEDAEQHVYVVWFENSLEKELLGEAVGLDPKIEAIQLGKGVIYWRVLKGSTLRSTFGQYLTKAKYKNYHTNRNIKTVRKIIEA